LFESSHELEEINWIELRICGEDNEEIFEGFLEKFISLLKEDFLIDLFNYERTEKVKNRLRSYGKLFYELRKENYVGDKFLVEEELDTDENHSIFAGIIQVDEVDNEIIFNELFGSYLKFSHVELINKSPIKPDRLKKLMEYVDFKLLRRGKLIEIDYLTLLDRFVTPTSMIFSYLFDGKDDLVFTVYSGHKIFNQVEDIIFKSLPNDIELNRINASSEEVDRLIDSYFKDWKTVEN